MGTGEYVVYCGMGVAGAGLVVTCLGLGDQVHSTNCINGYNILLYAGIPQPGVAPGRPDRPAGRAHHNPRQPHHHLSHHLQGVHHMSCRLDKYFLRRLRKVTFQSVPMMYLYSTLSKNKKGKKGEEV